MPILRVTFFSFFRRLLLRGVPTFLAVAILVPASSMAQEYTVNLKDTEIQVGDL